MTSSVKNPSVVSQTIGQFTDSVSEEFNGSQICGTMTYTVTGAEAGSGNWMTFVDSSV
jgi:hypothetical protein